MLNGRTRIETKYDEITRDNLMDVLNQAVIVHQNNVNDINRLYKYYRGRQDILYRKKDVRPEICNRIVRNRANEIVSFKVGYLCGEPIQYVSRSEKDISKKIKLLNDFMDYESKPYKDKELIEWCTICGTSYRMVLPSDDNPFVIYSPDPRFTFVIYSNKVDKKPLAGVYFTVDNGSKTYTIYTDKKVFTVVDDKIVDESPNGMFAIPIIEYRANNSMMGAFEPVMSMLDALNTIESNRVDGVEQFVQSLLVFYNCQLPEGTSNNYIRDAGMLFLKQFGENKADIKEIASQLDQSQVQTLINDLDQTINVIVGMPSQTDGNTSDSSNNGAVILRQGWQTAEARAKDSEIMFKRSETEFLKIVLNICDTLGFNLGLKLYDIDIHFTRRNYSDILAKAQVLTTMLASDKIAPKLAFTACGMFIDSETAYLESMKYYEETMAKETESLTNKEEVVDEG